MQSVTALDSQHTQELQNDKNRIAQLERDVAAGRRRVQVRAACPDLSASGTTACMDDAARSGLDNAARRDYFTLRQRIERANRQINGLQDYVRQVCLRTQ